MTSRNVILAIVVVAALAGAGLLTAGVVLDGDGAPTSDSDTGADGNGTDSADDERTDAGNGDDPGGGDANPDDGGGQQADEEDADGDSVSRDTAEYPVEIYAADRGPIDEGELRLYNTTSGERVATYNVSDGHEHTFENLTRETTYDLVINVSYYPDKTITFNPRISDEINETIGYEFQGADTFEMDWRVKELYGDSEIDDENPKISDFYGYTALDADGNYYTGFSAQHYRDDLEYLYLASKNITYYDPSVSGTDWKQSIRDKRPSVQAKYVSRDGVVSKGLSSIKNRTFVERFEPAGFQYDVLDVYNITGPADDGDPLTVHVDPDTGYVVYMNARIDEMADPNATLSEAEMYSHDDENFSAIPDDFPLEKIENE